jgi:hypothetical protein
LYQGPKSDQTLKAAAPFDLIDAGSHAATNGQIWPTLRQLNPHLKIYVYEMGPGEFNAKVDFQPGQGWFWMTANHGLSSSDRWTAVGTYGDYVQNNGERLMIIGNPRWQQYWLDAVSRFWTPESPNDDTDGVFSDNTDYEWPSEGHWYRQGNPKETDVPADYYKNGVYVPEIWKKEAKAFLDKAVTFLEPLHRQIIPNFGYMSKDPQSWHDLDSQPHPVFAAMEEGAFVTPWGVPGHFTFYSEQDWLHQVNALRHLRHIRALMLVHGTVISNALGPERLDATDVGGANRGSDVLWFGITSFLQGYDDVRQNAYLGFTVWGYGAAYYLDEFDPAHLNLGRALGKSDRVDAAAGHCYMREFDAGWAVVNPTDSLAQGVSVPAGQARVLDHYTFEHADAQPLVGRFDLPAHRGIILLKPGRHAGNAG